MKRSLVVFIFTVLIASNSFSQRLNFVGGLTMNQLKSTNFMAIDWAGGTGDPLLTKYITTVHRTKLRPSWFAGVNFDKNFKNKTGVSTGFHYIRRSLYNENSFHFQQVSVPVNFTYQIYPKFRLFAGPQVDFPVGKYIENTDKVNMSGSLGLKYQPIQAVQLGLNFNRNFSSILNESFDKKSRFDYNTFFISAGYPI